MSVELVVQSLRKALGSRWTEFVEAVAGRAHQLTANMVDGRVLSQAQADETRAGILRFLEQEALPALATTNPTAGLVLLDRIAAYGMTQLEGERHRLESARAARFPPPSPLDWPEFDELRRLAADSSACSFGPPVTNIYFAKALADDERLHLSDELLSLYATMDGIDLCCAASSGVPVFSLLPSGSIEASERSGKTPKRAVVFHGGDEIGLAVYRDRSKTWWLVYEHDSEPVARSRFDLRELLRFALERMNAPTLEALDAELSWDRFFETGR